jgi:hypothetical protein
MFAKNWIFVVSLGVLALALTAVPAGATVIISDGFSGADGAALNGRTPDGTNLPGVNWQITGGYFGSPSISSNTLDVPSIGGGALNISSVGSYTKPTVMTIAADLEVGNLNGGDNPEGMGLGFWSALHPGGGSLTDFYGLMLRNNGSLSLTKETTVYQTVAWAGSAFSTNTFYTLSYSVDTNTGRVTSVSLAGSTADYSAIINDTTVLFTDTNTKYAGIRADAGSAGRHGYADNFNLTPEPATMALLGLGGLGLILSRKRK